MGPAHSLHGDSGRCITARCSGSMLVVVARAISLNISLFAPSMATCTVNVVVFCVPLLFLIPFCSLSLSAPPQLAFSPPLQLCAVRQAVL